MSSGHVNHKGRRVATMPGSSFNTYDYKSPGVTLPNERKKGEELEELSSGVTITQLSKEDTERYLTSRRIGKLSRVKTDKK